MTGPTLTFGFRLPKVSNLMREVTGTTPKKALLVARLVTYDLLCQNREHKLNINDKIYQNIRIYKSSKLHGLINMI